jgi:hypothetical protein
MSSQKTAAAGNENFHKLDYTERKREAEISRGGVTEKTKEKK